MITTDNLTKQYGETIVLNQLNLNIGANEIYCLLGANGAGKTTTINLLLGFIKPTSGSAFINGLCVSEEYIKTKQYLAYIPENLMLYPTLTAVENLKYFSGIGGKNLNKSQSEDFLNEAGLQKNAFNQRISTFSKGMRQKVGISIALAKDAKSLLLDEPTSGLDPKSSNEFGQLLHKLKDNGVSILMATHDLFRAKDTGTHIGIMKNGELRQEYATKDISLPELEQAYLEAMNYKELVS